MHISDVYKDGWPYGYWILPDGTLREVWEYCGHEHHFDYDMIDDHGYVSVTIGRSLGYGGIFGTRFNSTKVTVESLRTLIKLYKRVSDCPIINEHAEIGFSYEGKYYDEEGWLKKNATLFPCQARGYTNPVFALNELIREKKLSALYSS